MTKLLILIWRLLSRKRKRQYALLLVLALLSAVAELSTVAAIIPFLSVLSGKGAYIPTLANGVRIEILEGKYVIETLLTALFALLTILSGLIRVANIAISNYVAGQVGSELGQRIIRNRLSHSVKLGGEGSSSQLISVSTYQMDRTVRAISATVQMITAVFIAIAMGIGILLVSSWVGLVSVIGCSVGYISVILLSKKKLALNSKLIAQGNTQRISVLQKIDGLKNEIRLYDIGGEVSRDFHEVDSLVRVKQAVNQTISSYPRFLFEALGLSVVALVGWYVAVIQGNGEAVTVIGSLGLVALRLLPAMQQIYGGWSNLNAYRCDIENVSEELRWGESSVEGYHFTSNGEVDSIELVDVGYRWEGARKEAMQKTSLEINRGELVCIAGESGSGKSTILKILMGLLSPSEGDIRINGTLHSERESKRILRGIVAYVPQEYALFDGTLKRNITITRDDNDSDNEEVKNASRSSGIDKKIEDMRGGFEYWLDDRGKELSGGERQRLVLARALYRKRMWLILDEPTSALNRGMEEGIMKTLQGLKGRHTIVIASHSEYIMRNCDRIIRVGQ